MSKLKSQKLEWEEATEVKEEIKHIVAVLDFSYIDHSRIFCYRTNGSKSRAYARIWAFPKIFQTALKMEPAYVIEVLAKYYDKLDNDKQKQVLIHELLHIPKNFSGALLPHRGRNRHLEKNASQLFKDYKKLTK
jgi:predicted metallopeptidase